MRESGLASQTFKYYYMGLYFQDCQKSVYKANFRPSQVACPHTYTYVHLTEEVKQQISAEKKPRLTPADAPVSYPVPSAEKAKAMGEQVVLYVQEEEDEEIAEIHFDELNDGGQALLRETMPQIFIQLGEDIVKNMKFILC